MIDRGAPVDLSEAGAGSISLYIAIITNTQATDKHL